MLGDICPTPAFCTDILRTDEGEQAVFQNGEQKIKTATEELRLLSASRLDKLTRIVLTTIAALLLLFPVYALFRLQPTSRADFYYRSSQQIATVFVFTMVFSVGVSVFTKAQRQEVFTATAAYCAVLVVFLGDISNVLMAQDIGR